ncbi:helix-turn-helix transcriptional regulator [Rhizobium sp. P40RR-XXII]|uniref:helix-turn-helix domain-containing protein n=1 Tax=Rhizobium sp. P40RR-XXII TaxID=2726739 RepID=UPI0014575911|nr:helix-turn-helix transcriptional regulator [Rhizobium sp. P40RR-XXII]NLS19869.1 helix-turn-helix transcriptional regulator [Rhizobium sp. P40RR-XXII]
MTLEQFLKSQEPKVSHAAFGESVGVTQATINRYVRGERFPSPDMIQKIHVATGGKVSVNDWYSTISEAAQ